LADVKSDVTLRVGTDVIGRGNPWRTRMEFYNYYDQFCTSVVDKQITVDSFSMLIA